MCSSPKILVYPTDKTCRFSTLRDSDGIRNFIVFISESRSNTSSVYYRVCPCLSHISSIQLFPCMNRYNLSEFLPLHHTLFSYFFNDGINLGVEAVALCYEFTECGIDSLDVYCLALVLLLHV